MRKIVLSLAEAARKNQNLLKENFLQAVFFDCLYASLFAVPLGLVFGWSAAKVLFSIFAFPVFSNFFDRFFIWLERKV